MVSEGYENLGGRYFSISSNYSLSLDYYLNAYEVYEKYNPSGHKYVPLLGIASTYKEQAQYAKALEYINRALPLIEAAKDERNHAIALENAGGVYWLMRDLPKAKESFMLAKEKFEKIKSMGGLIFCYVGLSNIAREEGDLTTSLSLSETALALGDKFPQYDGAKLHGLRSMGKTLYALKKYEEA